MFPSKGFSSPRLGPGRPLVPTLLVALVLAALFQTVPGVAQEEQPGPAPDPEVPYGEASSYIIGRQLLQEGMVAEALRYLHPAYRSRPEVPAIALDFQEALSRQGYFSDAVEVMDKLVAAFPDSHAYRLRRSELLVQMGEFPRALADLRHLRTVGEPSLEVVAAEAALLARTGSAAQALDVLRDGLHLFPDAAAEIYLEMSRILQQNQQAEAIPALMEEALVRAPDDPRLWLIRIRAEAGLGRHEKALEIAADADRRFGRDGAPPREDRSPPVSGAAPGPAWPEENFRVELADFYAQHGQVARAQGILETLAAGDGLALGPSLWLGRMLLGTGQFAAADSVLQTIVARWPESGRGWFLRGKWEDNAGDYPAALDAYTRAVEAAPGDPEVRLALVRMLLLVAGEPGGADALSPQEIKERIRTHALAAAGLVAEEDHAGQMVLGYAFRTVEDLERAARQFELAGEDPDFRLNAFIQASLCLDELGRPEKARAFLETLHSEDPGNPEISNSLGYFLAEKNQDLGLAEDLVKAALATEPNNGAYLDSLGWVYFRLGRLDDALDYLIRAVNVLPDDPVILEHLAVVLRDLGQTEEARDMFRRAQAVGGDAERLKGLLDGLPQAAGRNPESP